MGRFTLAISRAESVALSGSSAALRASQDHGSPSASGGITGAAPAAVPDGVVLGARPPGAVSGEGDEPEPGIGVPLRGVVRFVLRLRTRTAVERETLL